MVLVFQADAVTYYVYRTTRV